MGKGYRQGRIGGEIQKLISEMLMKDLKDPRLSEGMISISDVEVTKDNSYATVYITVLTAAATEEEKAASENNVIEGLKSASPMIRKEIGRLMKLRHTPELIFKIDRSMEYGRHIDEVIRRLNDEQK